jgi:hypothetical protein
MASGTRSRSPATGKSPGPSPPARSSARLQQRSPDVDNDHRDASPSDHSFSTISPDPPGDEAPAADHPHIGLFKPAPPERLDQPLTAKVAHSLPRGSWIHRMALKALEVDTKVSTVLHRSVNKPR